VRPRANKVTIDSIGSRIYEKSIGTKMNDLDLRLEVVWRSCQPLRDIRPWLSPKPLEIEAWFQRPPIGNHGNGIWAIKWSRGRWRHIWPWKVKSSTPIRLERNISTSGDMYVKMLFLLMYYFLQDLEILWSVT